MTKYELGRPGYQFITRSDDEMELIFLYDNKYYRKAAIMKIAKTLLNKSWNTITRYIENVYTWSKLEEVGIFPYLSAKVLDEHCVVTNGDILNRNTLRRIIVGDSRGKCRLMEDGEIYEFYPSSVVYYKFLLQRGEAFDPEVDTPFLVDRRFWSPDINNLRRKEVIKDARDIPHYEEDKIND
jgi:hypothetical protein